MVDESVIIGFDADKLLSSLTLIDNRNINFLSNTLQNNTRFLKYLENKLEDKEKINRIEQFITNLTIIKSSDDENLIKTKIVI